MKHFKAIAVCLMLLLSLAGVFSKDKAEKSKDEAEKSKEDAVKGKEDALEGEEEDAVEFKIDLVAIPDDCEKKSAKGDILVVQYEATMPVSGVVFDTTADRKRPFHFTLGEGKVMKGWEEGLMDMCVGEIRDLTIPPGDYQKGDQGSGALIPHDKDLLVYNFKLLGIRNTPPPINMFKEMDTDGEGSIDKEEMLAYLKNEGLGGLKDNESIDDVIDHIFEGQDTDGDDRITHAEFGGPKHDEF